MEPIYYRILYPSEAYEYHPGLVEIMQYLIRYKAEWDWDFVLFRTLEPNEYEIVGTFDALVMVSERLPKNSFGRAFGEKLIPGRIPFCQRCGCHYFSKRASGFRAIDGMISKVKECSFCTGLNTENAIATSEIYRTKNTPAAIEFQIQNFIAKENGQNG